MGLFDFVRDAGAKILDALTPGQAHADALKQHLQDVGLGNPAVTATVEGGKVIVTGEVGSQEEKEKILLALGNVKGIETVEDQITVSAPSETAARFVTVKSGDTLSAIAKREYKDANKYLKIFEANKPMLKDPNKIYPGQVLRIPE